MVNLRCEWGACPGSNARKLADFRQLSQNAPHVEVLERLDDDAWRLREVRGLDASLRIEAIDVTLSLAELYDRVEFSSAKPA